MITLKETLNAYWNKNADIPHIALKNGKCFHNACIETMNDTDIKFVNHKAIKIDDIEKIEIPQHSSKYNNTPFRELVCQKYLGKDYESTKKELRSDYTDIRYIRKYTRSKATEISKEINGVKVVGIMTYGTLTDMEIGRYAIGEYWSSTSSKWGTFGNGINKIWND